MKSETKTPLKYLYFFTCIFTFLFLLYAIVIPVTPSIDKNLLVLDFQESPILKGDYVMFQLDHELIGGKKRAVKIIGCMEGQFLTRKDNAFFCNSTKITEARLYRDSGEELPQFHFNGPIPANKAFVYGTHKYSFGSRHWGFIDLKQSTRLIAIL